MLGRVGFEVGLDTQILFWHDKWCGEESRRMTRLPIIYKLNFFVRTLYKALVPVHIRDAGNTVLDEVVTLRGIRAMLYGGSRFEPCCPILIKFCYVTVHFSFHSVVCLSTWSEAARDESDSKIYIAFQYLILEQ